MENDDIDYAGLPYHIQREIDQKAYAKYYKNCFNDDSLDETLNSYNINPTLTFNNWYGTYLHKNGIKPFLRKYKLEKIKKAS
jgi:hypothetical protein